MAELSAWMQEKLAGEAIGKVLDGIEGRDAFLWERHNAEIWVPRSSGDQALLLVERLHLHIDQRPGLQISVQSPDFEIMVCYEKKKGHALDLTCAITECAALIRLRSMRGARHG